jgi:predicted nucleotidyltransferase
MVIMDKKISSLIIDLENIFKDRLESIILYGSAAFGEFQQNISDLNLIIVIENLMAEDLKAASPVMKKWTSKTKNPAPVFMDKQEMLNSCDVYPIEYSDIKERHKVLYGEDFLDCLVIENCFLRLQCEAEIRNLLIKLRQNYLKNSDDKKLIDNLVKKSATSIIAIFRAVLRLMGQTVPSTHREVVNLLAAKIDFDKDIFTDILLLREEGKSVNNKDSIIVIQRLINSLKVVLKYIDKMEDAQEG